MRLRRWGCVLVVLGLALSITPVSSACSCAGGYDPRRALDQAGGAFIGRSLGRVVPSPRPSPTPHPAIVSSSRPVDVRFDVFEDFKDNLGEQVTVRTSSSGASCGFHAPAGKNVAMLLYREQGRWTSSLCSQTDPATLRKAAAPLPAPDGEPPVRFLLGGSMGDARTFSLDAKGRTVAYARGPGSTGGISLCPGSDVFVELVSGVVEREWWKLAIATRDVHTLRLRSEHRFTTFEAQNGIDSASPGGIACLDPSGRTIAVYGREQDDLPSVTRFVRVDGDDERVVYEGRTTAVDLHEGSAYVVEDTKLRQLDLRTGRIVDRAEVPPGTRIVDVSPDSRHAVMSATGDGDETKKGHYVLDLVSGALRKLETRLSGYAWVNHRMFAAFGPREEVRIFDTSLRKRTQWTGWGYGGVVDSDVVYTSSYGEVLSAPVRTGPKKIVKRFDFDQNFTFVVVPRRGLLIDKTQPPARTPARSDTPAPVAAHDAPVSSSGLGTSLFAGALAMALLAAAILLRRRSAPGR